MAVEPTYSRFADMHVEDQLDAERRHSDHMAEVLRTLKKYLRPDDSVEHIIAVQGTQITIGQIVEGALALHEQRKI